MPTIEVSDQVYKRLQRESAFTGMTIPELINHKLWVEEIRLKCARQSAEIDATLAGSDPEISTLIVLHDARLLPDELFARHLVIANRYPSHGVAKRLADLRAMVAELLEELEPQFAERRAALADQKAEWVAKSGPAGAKTM